MVLIHLKARAPRALPHATALRMHPLRPCAPALNCSPVDPAPRAQRTEEHQFLYEAPAATPVAELTAALAALYNARLRLSRLCAEGAELASFGPMRPPEQQARPGSRPRSVCGGE